ncbi:MAG: RsmE family RNA methyltransferase [Phycisphaerae bacterium]|jgi:16S rRNA (uracil1498-N3)-methyltransferase
MVTHAFYVPESRCEVGANVRIAGDQAHHAARVLRVAEGMHAVVRDGRGTVASCVVTSVSKDRSSGEWMVEARVEAMTRRPSMSPAVHVVAACPKGDRLAEMVEGLSQAGASSFTPLVAERSVVDPGGAKLERLRRIASESLKQCRRDWVMDVNEPVGLEAALQRAAAAGWRVLVADATGKRAAPIDCDTALLVGPEGGWSERERSEFAARGLPLVGFGPHVMRIETAAVVGAAMIHPIDQAPPV